MASVINWAAIDWVSLAALSLLVLFVAHIGERLSFGSRTLGALVTAMLFAVGFAIWSHGLDDAVNQVVATVRSGQHGG